MAKVNKARVDGVLVWLTGLFLLSGASLIVGKIFSWRSRDISALSDLDKSLSGSGMNYQAGADVLILLSMVLALAGLAVALIYVVKVLHNICQNSELVSASMGRIVAGQTHHEAVLTQMNENLLLSDSIKSVAFRRKDRSVLESAIRQDIRAEQWESAEMLIGELQERFGCREEAQQLRQELQRYQQSNLQEKVRDSLKHLESLWIIHNYVEAQQQEDDLLELYPDNPQVQEIKGLTAQKREDHKKELLSQLEKATEDNDVDRGVGILEILDNYLTPTEAAALQESARSVLKARLHKMGVQFSLFVTEHSWDKALRIGREITKEYPNSRMAHEVREKLEILEQRAGETVTS